MTATGPEILNDLYNLILNPGTREFERSLLEKTKNKIENGADSRNQLSKLEASLRPLALRNNLTPDVTDFYLKITGHVTEKFDIVAHTKLKNPHYARAIFSGGCFWCMVEPFETKEGVISVLSGYTGGDTPHPTYEQVSGGYTGHTEAVEIIFDTLIIQYLDLVTLYFQLTDPTDALGQMADRGSQYRPVIYVLDDGQREVAERFKQQLIDSKIYKRPIVTAIEPASTFWPAENFHQQFYKNNPKRYAKIKRARKQFLFFQHLKLRLRHFIKR
ncbi:peptide-methionine (S)-S-oxide reductase MsrA [Listeria fleischmannii]|nr:peptide-methionine (S)-S-oxide reductase MsrA [Listeria fleischmannii]MBC1420072.1 peptide-methionine (S)-S-oxide reductase MsrA [Listeria fleischmannii]